MNYLKLYEDFSEIENICHKYGILEDYTINQDGTVDVNGSVYLDGFDLKEIPLNFGYVSDYFLCRQNKLTSLKGCPKKVWGSLLFGYNKLTTLIGCTKIIGGNMWFNNNQLIDFYGFPEKFNRELHFTNNPVYEILSIFDERRNLDRIKFIQYLNEYEVIHGHKIFEDGLKQAFYMITKKELHVIDSPFKNYELI